MYVKQVYNKYTHTHTYIYQQIEPRAFLVLERAEDFLAPGDNCTEL